jgi:hypothetical protein
VDAQSPPAFPPSRKHAILEIPETYSPVPVASNAGRSLSVAAIIAEKNR